MNQHGKATRKKLRKLAGVAYERELGRELENLSKQFSLWNEKKITSFELSDKIHEFHHGPSRTLYGRYNNFDPDALVARAVAQKILNADEVTPPILEVIKQKIDFFSTEIV